MTDLTELLGRVMNAEGPDRELDLTLTNVFDPHPDGWGYTWENKYLPSFAQSVAILDLPTSKEYLRKRYMDQNNLNFVKWPDVMLSPRARLIPPCYTASIDSAISLVERVLPGWCWKIVRERDRRVFVVRDAPELAEVAPAWTCSGATAPLVILSALLQALIQKTEVSL